MLRNDSNAYITNVFITIGIFVQTYGSNNLIVFF